MADRFTLIQSVLGFNLKGELRDVEGNIISTGVKRTCYSCSKELPAVGTRAGNRKWFDHYNQALLDKIRDMRRLND